MKVWVIKYALTTGVKEVDALPTHPGYVIERGGYNGMKLGRDAFLSEAEALAGAELKRLNKIKSLKQQIEKLERMTFK